VRDTDVYRSEVRCVPINWTFIRDKESTSSPPLALIYDSDPRPISPKNTMRGAGKARHVAWPRLQVVVVNQRTTTIMQISVGRIDAPEVYREEALSFLRVADVSQ
jgi:hypothetical protein